VAAASSPPSIDAAVNHQTQDVYGSDEMDDNGVYKDENFEQRQYDLPEDPESEERSAGKNSSWMLLGGAGIYGVSVLGMMKYQKMSGVTNKTIRFGQARVFTQGIALLMIVSLAVSEGLERRKQKAERIGA
jgi:hypothetical protein